MKSSSTDSAASVPTERAPPLDPNQHDAFLTVGVGASAGGFEAFTQLLKHLPAPSGLALILIQHLDPTHASSLVDLLAKTSPLPVCQVNDGMPVQVDHV